MPFDIQKEFINNIISNTNMTDEKQSIYHELVFIQFESIITNALPLFCSQIEDKILNDYIYDFINYGSKSPYVWKTIFEFEKFLIDTKRLKSKDLKDILICELKEIKIYSLSKKVNSSSFSWDKRYLLSQDVHIIQSNTDIVNQTFEKTKQYSLIYKDKNDFEVYHIDISQLIYKVLVLLKSNTTTHQILKLVCRRLNMKFETVKDILTDTLNKFTLNGILVKHNI